MNIKKIQKCNIVTLCNNDDNASFLAAKVCGMWKCDAKC